MTFSKIKQMHIEDVKRSRNNRQLYLAMAVTLLRLTMKRNNKASEDTLERSASVPELAARSATAKPQKTP